MKMLLYLVHILIMLITTSYSTLMSNCQIHMLLGTSVRSLNGANGHQLAEC